jgi:membrane protease YdiL (CAAX protease family)
MENLNKQESKRILIFLIITFILTYALEILVIGRVAKSADPNLKALTTPLIAAAMLIPSAGVVITRIITKEGFKDLWIRLNLKGNKRYYVMAWFGMVVLSAAGAAIYFAVFPNNYDPNLSYLAGLYKSAGQNISAEELKKGMYAQMAIGIFFSPILNAVFCFGEEWGWRGYLLPKMMKKFKLLPMLLINGIIWGLWHAPITALGHNYGLEYAYFPFTGIFAMCVFCIVFGTISSYLSIRTKSCIPAVIAHGSLNGFAMSSKYFTTDGGNPFIGPAPTGIIGGIAFIAAAVILYFLMSKGSSEEKISA